ncbi:ImmA/IrrE family metallo-endopeptidase [Liquorilactobacillus nagelii]|uniref:ImmA/IrrE family metallo-endopeptidase n=1 Tax=Liquorilactobacillus nagelii TaxID=82688 RepID=UPI0039E9DF54
MEQILSQLTAIAHQKKITIFWTKSLSATAPSIACAKQKIIIMNQNWTRPHELIFQLAHELAHLLLNDPTDQILYHTSASQLISIEYQTNQLAIRLLIPFYLNETAKSVINSQFFIQSFGLPQHCSKLVEQEIAHYLAECH